MERPTVWVILLSFAFVALPITIMADAYCDFMGPAPILRYQTHPAEECVPDERYGLDECSPLSMHEYVNTFPPGEITFRTAQERKTLSETWFVLAALDPAAWTKGMIWYLCCLAASFFLWYGSSSHWLPKRDRWGPRLLCFLALFFPILSALPVLRRGSLVKRIVAHDPVRFPPDFILKFPCSSYPCTISVVPETLVPSFIEELLSRWDAAQSLHWTHTMLFVLLLLHVGVVLGLVGVLFYSRIASRKSDVESASISFLGASSISFLGASEVDVPRQGDVESAPVFFLGSQPTVPSAPSAADGRG